MSLKNSKAKGNRQEHRTMRLLEAAGYRCTRSAASLGEFDVIGMSATDWVCVQVKSNRRPGSLEMAVLRDVMVPPGTRKLLHVWRDRQRMPLVEEIP